MNKNKTLVSCKEGSLLATALTLSLYSGLSPASTPFEECLLKQAVEADGATTLTEIRALCSRENDQIYHEVVA